MKNILDNKRRFFALYWGQQIMRLNFDHPENTDVYEIDRHNMHSIEEEEYLELKPLSSITDEDAIELSKFQLWNEGKEYEMIDSNKKRDEYLIKHAKFDIKDSEIEQKHTNLDQSLYAKSYDFLRSKGYALPYLGISVETLVEWGWVKLKE